MDPVARAGVSTSTVVILPLTEISSIVEATEVFVNGRFPGLVSSVKEAGTDAACSLLSYYGNGE